MPTNIFLYSAAAQSSGLTYNEALTSLLCYSRHRTRHHRRPISWHQATAWAACSLRGSRGSASSHRFTCARQLAVFTRPNRARGRRSRSQDPRATPGCAKQVPLLQTVHPLMACVLILSLPTAQRSPDFPILSLVKLDLRLQFHATVVRSVSTLRIPHATPPRPSSLARLRWVSL